ncbi:hypothetical protein DC094_16740 [Pelagibaculum spongiae]|uniref:Uncharacterized protein n=2 Tax=Pelagibaculum spongiae TaxID=2080658 RepID=A0A2V1GXH8_9GAMM|nr:hypothetical protein DC094_16740 [Pelagibaculum spongiae]
MLVVGTIAGDFLYSGVKRWLASGILMVMYSFAQAAWGAICGGLFGWALLCDERKKLKLYRWSCSIFVFSWPTTYLLFIGMM